MLEKSLFSSMITKICRIGGNTCEVGGAASAINEGLAAPRKTNASATKKEAVKRDDVFKEKPRCEPATE
ncbi:hypothetical protein ACP_2724 [Acidobacterium capsulatum ATCC 51196]|uniref:Uncharacterized protein n=1 Tax=Acidobacterium capsulatum (strain ATCC 51196 / DSM 11244 / BCRC 80197 / JCM 7670 / NBRC 15755 / NCIMB 13165 / 161) TaxID=240015 RepID=C1F332_ACIC5|nr:hypothetical protein ACP_2724 [Acidobacterium capsulatum ATCC 51196]